MTITRAQMKQIFEHLLMNVFGAEATSNLYLTLKQNKFDRNHPSTFTNLTDKNIEELSYVRQGETLATFLDVHGVNIIKVFQDFMKYKTGQTVDVGDVVHVKNRPYTVYSISDTAHSWLTSFRLSHRLLGIRITPTELVMPFSMRVFSTSVKFLSPLAHLLPWLVLRGH
jgi:hypothetical protein